MADRFAYPPSFPPRAKRHAGAAAPLLAALVIATLAFLPTWRAAFAGELEHARRDARNRPRSESNDSESNENASDRWDRDEDDDDDDDCGLVGSIVGGLLTCAFSGKDNDDHLVPAPPSIRPPAPQNYFTRYPFADDYAGHIMFENWTPSYPQLHSFRGGLDYGGDFRRLRRASLGGLLESHKGPGIDARWKFYSEALPEGGHDSLHLGDVNLLYRFLDTPRVQCRWGVGANWLADHHGAEAGLNFTLQTDVFLGDRFHVFGELDGGSLGATGRAHGEITAGVFIRRLEIYGGFDWEQIGGADFETAILGARVWY